MLCLGIVIRKAQSFYLLTFFNKGIPQVPSVLHIPWTSNTVGLLLCSGFIALFLKPDEQLAVLNLNIIHTG